MYILYRYVPNKMEYNIERDIEKTKNLHSKSEGFFLSALFNLTLIYFYYSIMTDLE